MDRRQRRVKRGKAYKLIQTICEGLLAVMAIAGGPAIVLLAFDPATNFVPYASRNIVIAALVLAGVILPMIPVVSFVFGTCPKKLGDGAGAVRIASVFVVACACLFLNNAALDWHDARAAESRENNRRIEDGTRAQSTAEKTELRELIEAAVSARCGRP